MELTFDTRLAPDAHAEVWTTLALDFDARQRPRAIARTLEDATVRFLLPRGTVLRGGDLVRAREDGRLLRIVASPEAVLTVTGSDAFALMRGAYHLGNRHVPVELRTDCLRLAPDPVLAEMATGLGLAVREDVAPFEPEAGAYQGGHGHHHHHHDDHEHAHAHAH